jgi:hypothetical protein
MKFSKSEEAYGGDKAWERGIFTCADETLRKAFEAVADLNSHRAAHRNFELNECVAFSVRK